MSWSNSVSDREICRQGRPLEGFFVSFHSPESVLTFSILGALALALISFPVFGDSITSISIMATTSEGPVRAYAVPRTDAQFEQG